MENEKKGISGFVLKMIAVISMLIDHTGAVIVEGKINMMAPNAMTDPNEIVSFAMDNPKLMLLDIAMRLIGRFAFPIFAFLIVEGFLHTRSVVKYAINLGVFALISEIPFNLAIDGSLKSLDHQNVFFTLFLGLICIWAIRELAEKERLGPEKWKRVVCSILLVAAFCAIAYVLKTDYGMWGVAVIAILYLLRGYRKTGFALACLLLTIMSLTEISSFLMLIPVAFYNGKRGPKINKYVFYAIYPLHLGILDLIAYYLNYISIP